MMTHEEIAEYKIKKNWNGAYEVAFSVGIHCDIEEALKDIKKRFRLATIKELQNELGKLDNCGGECCCDEPETTLLIHTGKWPELLNTCLSCAGCVDL